MKRYIKYLAGCSLLLAFLSGCGKEQPGPAPSAADGDAIVRLSFTLPEATRAYDALETSVLRIYKVESDGAGGETEGLIRKYQPATDIPADIYLAAGKYRVVIEAGDNSKASFTNKTYHGDTTFTLTDHEVKSVEVLCKLTNIAVRVKFDETIAEKFDPGYKLYVSASDVFSKTAAEAGAVPTLTYAADGTGYFILPAGVSDINWGFYCSSSDPIISRYPGEYTGTVSAPQGGMLYTLTYKFSDFVDGYLSVSIDAREYESKHDDHFSFSPQPRVSGIGFSLANIIAGHIAPLNFQLSSLNPFASLAMDVNGVRYDIMTGSVVNNALKAQGITCVMDGGDSGTLTIDENFIAQLPGGINDLAFSAKDTDGTDGSAIARVAVAGAVGIAESNLWFKTGTLSAVATDPATTEVKIRYKEDDADDWIELDAVLDADYQYLAAGASLSAGHTYHIQLLENGAVSGTTKIVSTDAGIQLPNASFEDWNAPDNKTWYPYAQGGTEFWGTGNPGSASMGSSVTVSDTGRTEGTKCAKLETKTIVIVKAAGNIFIGKFGAISGMGGTVQMGRKFSFNARPTALRAWCKYTRKGSDKGRVYVCLVKMKDGVTYHTVDTNNAAKTAFYPDEEFLYTDKTNTSTLEGHVIAYGDQMIETTVGDWTEFVIPITYRDQYLDEEPNVLMVTATASYDGDNLSSNITTAGSILWIDDVEFIY